MKTKEQILKEINGASDWEAMLKTLNQFERQTIARIRFALEDNQLCVSAQDGVDWCLNEERKLE